MYSDSRLMRGDFAAPDLGIDLGDVEDVHLAAKQLDRTGSRLCLVVVAGDDVRRIGGKLGDAL